MENVKNINDNHVDGENNNIGENINALNDCSLGVLHSLWYLVNSPMFVVMEKMREFDNLSNFLIAASESKSRDFFNLDYADIERKMKEEL